MQAAGPESGMGEGKGGTQDAGEGEEGGSEDRDYTTMTIQQIKQVAADFHARRGRYTTSLTSPVHTH